MSAPGETSRWSQGDLKSRARWTALPSKAADRLEFTGAATDPMYGFLWALVDLPTYEIGLEASIRKVSGRLF